jgi:hypothetical protein
MFRSRCLVTNVISEPFASNGGFYGSTVLGFSKYGTVLSQIISLMMPSPHVETHRTEHKQVLNER